MYRRVDISDPGAGVYVRLQSHEDPPLVLIGTGIVPTGRISGPRSALLAGFQQTPASISGPGYIAGALALRPLV